MSFDPAEFRALFPLFCARENADLIYLDNAATTPMPLCAIEAMTHYASSQHANVNRASHRLARQATANLEATRTKTARFLNAHTNEIVFTRGATEGLNLLATVLSESWSPGDEVILGPAEHHANLLPWQRLAQTRGIVVRYLPLKDGVPQIALLPSLLNARTRAVSISLVSNVLGYSLSCAPLAAALNGTDVVLIVDAAQAVVHEPLDVQAMGCDFLVFSAHKVYGPTGVGVLYGRSALLEALPPWQVGGDTVRTVTENTAEFTVSPQRFEAGTLALGALAGWGATLDFLRHVDRQACWSHERGLAQLLLNELSTLSALRVLSPIVNNVGVVTVAMDTQGQSERQSTMADLGLWLDSHDVAVRVGYHCAQPLYQRLGVSQGLRVSIAAYNTSADIECTLDLIREWLATFKQKKSSCSPRIKDPEPFFSCDDVTAVDVTELLRKRDQRSRYFTLMSWGDFIQEKEALRTAKQRVEGCEADTWLAVRVDRGVCYCAVDSTSRLVRGLGAVMLTWFHERRVEAILAEDVTARCRELGLDQYLSATRISGFHALIEAALRAVRA